MILIAANLLNYAIDAAAPRHRPARRRLERTLSDTAPVGLPWIVILAFVRITTHAGIMRRPLPPAIALAIVQSWLEQPCVETVTPGNTPPNEAGLTRYRLAFGARCALSPARRVSLTTSLNGLLDR